MGLKSLVDFDTYKLYSDNNVSDKDKALIERLLKSSSDYVRKYTNQDFSLTKYKESFYNFSMNNIILNVPFVNSVLSVNLNGNILSLDKFSNVNNSLTIKNNNINYNFSDYNSMLVEYVSGSEDIPEDIVQAVIHLTMLRYNERKRIGELSKNIADSTITYDNNSFPGWIEQALQPYIIWGFDGQIISREDYNE